MSVVPHHEGDAGPILSAEERAAQFKRGPPALPRKWIWIAIAILAVLGIGGAFADSSFNVPATSPPTTKVHDARRVPESLAQFVNLRVLARRPAPPVDLVDQSARSFTLGRLRGRAVALTFLDPRCRDICPVEAAEMRNAAADLGAARAEVVFVIIDANPHDVGAAAARSGISTTGLSSLPNVYFLSGSLRELDEIWTTYGVTVEYAPSTGQLGHTNVIDVIDPSGRLDYALEPFGNESKSGTFRLPAAEMKRFAKGIAEYLDEALR
jgi:cytochrome oxidase Cu insertion factor (SCO1/SenC/PrrC family)